MQQRQLDDNDDRTIILQKVWCEYGRLPKLSVRVVGAAHVGPTCYLDTNKIYPVGDTGILLLGQSYLVIHRSNLVRFVGAPMRPLL